MEVALQGGWDADIDKQLCYTRRGLNQFLVWEAELIQQQSRQKWLSDGDRNTAYFHASIRDCAKMNNIRLCKEDGTWCTDTNEIW